MKKAVTNIVTTVLLAVCFLNFLPDTMHAVASVPVLGDMVRLLDIGTYRKYFSWGSSTLQMELPEVEFPVESVTVAEEQPEQAQAASGTDGQEPSEEASPESTAPSGSFGKHVVGRRGKRHHDTVGPSHYTARSSQFLRAVRAGTRTGQSGRSCLFRSGGTKTC